MKSRNSSTHGQLNYNYGETSGSRESVAVQERVDRLHKLLSARHNTHLEQKKNTFRAIKHI